MAQSNLRNQFLQGWKNAEQQQSIPSNMPFSRQMEGLTDTGSRIARGFVEGFTAAPWMAGEGIASLALTPYDMYLNRINRKTNQGLFDTLGSQKKRISRNDKNFGQAIDAINVMEQDIRDRQTQRETATWNQLGKGIKDTTVGSFGSALTMLGAGAPAASLGLTGAIGAGSSALQGQDIAEGFGRGASQGFKVAGLNRLTSPFINPAVTRASELVTNPVAQTTIKSGTAGALNVLEDEFYTRLAQGQTPTNIDRIASFGMGAAMAPFVDYGIKSPEMQSRYEKLGGQSKLYEDIDYSVGSQQYNYLAGEQAQPVQQGRILSPIDQEIQGFKQQVNQPMSMASPDNQELQASSLPPINKIDTSISSPQIETPSAMYTKYPTPWSVPKEIVGTAQDPYRSARAGISAPEIKTNMGPVSQIDQATFQNAYQVPRELWGTVQDPWASQRGFIRFGFGSDQPIQKTGEMPVFRAADSGTGKADLGKGKYFAFDPENVTRYGKDIQEFKLDADAKMLDLRDPQALQQFTENAIRDYPDVFTSGATPDDKVGGAITAAAKAQGFDGILGDDKIFGSVVFDDSVLKSTGNTDFKPSSASDNVIKHKTQATRARKATHTAPTAEGNAPLYDVVGKYTENKIYPDDIYSYEASRMYSAGEPYDSKAINVIQSLKEKPNTRVTVYRAVPKDGSSKLEPGDWVSLTKEYAQDHGKSNIDGDYKIVKKSVMSRDLFTDGNSIHEWGYDPQPKISLEEKSRVGLPISEQGQARLERNRARLEKEALREDFIRDSDAKPQIDRDTKDLQKALNSLIDEGKLTESASLGGKDLTYKTRMLKKEIIDIISDRPDLRDSLPEEVLEFVESGYIPDESFFNEIKKLKGYKIENPQKITSPSVIRGGNPLSSQGESTGMVARERFDIPNLKKVGQGSDRIVFDLGDDKVLKIAKTARGLDQTMNAGDFYAEQAGLIPTIYEKGDNYLVTAKASKPGKETKQMLKLWQETYQDKLSDVPNAESAFVDATNAMAESKYADKFPFYDMLNYNPAINDVFAVRNWGEIDGKPVMVDAGSLSGSFLEGQQRGMTKMYGGEFGYGGVRYKTDNLADPEFSSIYNRNKAAKAKFGDPKGTAMYGAIPFFFPGMMEERRNNERQ